VWARACGWGYCSREACVERGHSLYLCNWCPTVATLREWCSRLWIVWLLHVCCASACAFFCQVVGWNLGELHEQWQ